MRPDLQQAAVLEALPHAAALLKAKKAGKSKPPDYRIRIDTEEELADFVLRAFGAKIPDVQVCPNHSTPWRAFCEAYFARSEVSIWKGSRGCAGKTFLLGLLGQTESVTLGADVSILGGSGEQSQRVHETMARFWAYPTAPRELLAGDPSQRQTVLKNGATIRALLASQASVRGPHPQRLRMDEIDEMDLAILDAATGQPMSKPGVLSQMVMSSTHQYQSGTMSEILDRAKERGWPVHEWCWRETIEPHGWLTRDEVARKRNQMSTEAWNVEVEMQKPNAEALAIQPEAVKRMFRRDLGVFRGDNGEYIEIEGPQSGATYAHGADWARTRDWTIVVTFRTDVHPIRMVAFQRSGRADWPLMVATLDDRQRRFGGTAKHDGTGLGDVVNGFLQVPAEGIWLAGHERKELFSEYVTAIEGTEIEAPYIEWMVKEHERATQECLFGSDHPPDTIVAGALGWSAANSLGAQFCAAGPKAPKVEDPQVYQEALAAKFRGITGQLIGGRR